MMLWSVPEFNGPCQVEAKTGRTYFYNPDKGCTQYEPPPGHGGGSPAPSPGPPDPLAKAKAARAAKLSTWAAGPPPRRAAPRRNAVRCPPC
jgi:hypothetical protein